MPTTEILIETLIKMRKDPAGVPLDQFWEMLEKFRADLINQAFVILNNQEALLSNAEQPSRFNFMFGATPWWCVSIALHVLIILLAGLISMSLEMPTAEDAVVVVTELQPATQIKQIEPEKPKVDNRVVLYHARLKLPMFFIAAKAQI